MFKNLFIHPNLKKYKNILNIILDDLCDTAGDTLHLCKNILLKYINPIIQNSKEQAKRWDSTFDYEKNIYGVISNISFDLVASGHFHIHRGHLTPTGEYLHQIHDLTLYWLYNNNHITKEQKNTNMKALLDNIKSVG